MDPKIETIFPTTILRCELGRDFTEAERFSFMQAEIFSRQNYGNIYSQNNYVLEQTELFNLKQTLINYLNYYLKNVILIKNNNQSIITQSWINFTKKGEYHHQHTHSNSFLSGVIYINAIEEDKIIFHNQKYNQIQLESKEFNYYNSSKWWFKVKTGDIIIFPSHLSHSVEKIESNHKRISLAFNMMPDGIWGNNLDLNEYRGK